MWIRVEDAKPRCDMTPRSFGVKVKIYPPWEDEIGDRYDTVYYGCRQTDAPNFYLFGRVLPEPTHWAPAPPEDE